MFQKQDIMRKVVYAMMPLLFYAVYLFGWRVVVLVAIVVPVATMSEYIFAQFRKNKKVTEAVWVTSLLFVLSVPPAVPLWVAVVGAMFAVVVGKEIYGGFGRNIFNPAITGRLFVYISFPILMQNTWIMNGNFGLIAHSDSSTYISTWQEAVLMLVVIWSMYFYIVKNVGNMKRVSAGLAYGVIGTIIVYVVLGVLANGDGFVPLAEIDAMSMVTPLVMLSHGQELNLWHMFIGYHIGSIGETSALLIILAGIYMIKTKTANWRMMVMTLFGATFFVVLFYYTGIIQKVAPHFIYAERSIGQQISDIVTYLCSGSLLFVAVFMSTDPITAPNKPKSQYVYGFLIGSITILIRVLGVFPEGVSFAIIFANTCSNWLDEMFSVTPKKAVK